MTAVLKGNELKDRLEAIREDFYLPPFADDIDLADLADLDGGARRYVLFERGHYGQTYVSTHATPEDAGHYSLNQEYAEDWAATVLLDTETGRTFRPEAISWLDVSTPGEVVPGA